MPVMALDMTGNFFLVGLMGAGKTTVGRALSRRFNKAFFDSDHEVEARTGVRIATIFDIEGEAGFREREREMIAELCQRQNVVLATGGGAVLDPRNREQLAHHGLVIYLRATPEELYHRTKLDRNRPLLQTADPLARLQTLYTQRDPLYREVADVIFDTSRQTVQSLLTQLEPQLQKLSHA
ncbi:shikimate kinase [Leeia sp.]|uniref:shikimate kinase n=1 Tax=Leeia sp. TaxID=2884678 RepID=UPI0035AEF58D